jgi:hypothetical protein
MNRCPSFSAGNLHPGHDRINRFRNLTNSNICPKNLAKSKRYPPIPATLVRAPYRACGREPPYPPLEERLAGEP